LCHSQVGYHSFPQFSIFTVTPLAFGLEVTMQIAGLTDTCARPEPGPLQLFSLCDCSLDASRIQTPHRACADIREPHRSEAHPDRIATGACELLHDLS
jgi:hypothetical protein